MSKVQISFELPEEQEECHTALDALKYKNTLFHFDQWLRSQLKYTELSAEVSVVYQTIRDKLWETIHDQGLADLIDG